MLPTTCPVCQHEPLDFDGLDAVCSNCRVYRKRVAWWQQPLLWARGKSWWWRLIPIAFFIMLFVQCQQSDELQRNNPVALLDFGMHELGHILFIPFGEFMTILGGSLFQCLFPLLWLGAALWKRWYVGAALCLAWFGYNLYDVAVYVADAQARLLPLATLSSDYDSAHDWYQLLTRMDMLESDQAIAAVLRACGGGAMLLGIGLACTLVVAMFVHWYRRPPTETGILKV
jgi:hypothetical protein